MSSKPTYTYRIKKGLVLEGSGRDDRIVYWARIAERGDLGRFRLVGQARRSGDPRSRIWSAFTGDGGRLLAGPYNTIGELAEPTLKRLLVQGEGTAQPVAQAAATPATAPEMVMVRSGTAGVFFGRLVSFDTTTAVAVMTQTRRVWYWAGAATLSELATLGPAKPAECKFPAPTTGEHVIIGVSEIIPVTSEALARLDAVPVWTEHV